MTAQASPEGLTVVLCTYMGERFLEAQLRSIEEQTVLPDAVIISDDGSTDATFLIAQAFRARTTIPTTIEQNAPRIGFADNFLKASQLACTEWVAFCDQDDIWLPHKVERCKVEMADPDVTLIVHRATLINETDREIGRFDQQIAGFTRLPPLSLDPWETYFGFSMVWRRSLLDLVDPGRRPISYIRDTGEGMAHDRWICFLATVCGTVVQLPERLAHYRQHGSNLYGAKVLQPVKPGRATRLYWNDRRISATRRLVEIVAEFDPEVAAGFARFDRAKAERQYRRGLKHLLARRRSYLKSGWRALAAVALGLLAGRYNGIGRGGFRRKPFLADLGAGLGKP